MGRRSRAWRCTLQLSGDRAPPNAYDRERWTKGPGSRRGGCLFVSLCQSAACAAYLRCPCREERWARVPRRRQTPPLLLLPLLLLSAVATRVRGLSSPPLSSLIRPPSPELLRLFPSRQRPGKGSLAHANASGK